MGAVAVKSVCLLMFSVSYGTGRAGQLVEVPNTREYRIDDYVDTKSKRNYQGSMISTFRASFPVSPPHPRLAVTSINSLAPWLECELAAPLSDSSNLLCSPT